MHNVLTVIAQGAEGAHHGPELPFAPIWFGVIALGVLMALLAILWQFRCDQGAYNRIDVFLLKTEYDGIRPVALARPEIKADYVDPEDSESAVKAITVIGWGAPTKAGSKAHSQPTTTIALICKNPVLPA